MPVNIWLKFEGGKGQQQLKKRKYYSMPDWVSFLPLSLPSVVYGESTSVCIKLFFLFAVHISVSGCFTLVIFWLLDFFHNVVHGHIWCVLWLLLSVSGASEIQALRFNNGPRESPWHCGYTVLCSGGRRGTGQPCQEHGMVTPGTLWPLMQQWQGKCAHLFCALWRQGLPGPKWERAELCPPPFTIGYTPASASAPGWPMWATASVPRAFQSSRFWFLI